MNKKRLSYLVPIFVLLAVGIIFAYTSQVPNPGHGANELLVSVGGHTMTLQEAIDNGFLVDNGPSPSQDYTTSVSGGHGTDKIFVSVNGVERTLQDSIALSTRLSSDSSSSYTSAITFGHNANEILVSVGGEEMTLQEAINDGEFNCVDSSWTPATSTVCAGQSFTQTSDCGNTRTATGTMADSSWTPATSTVCSYQTFTQTGNCGSTRVVYGTKNCNWELFCQCQALNPAVLVQAWHKFENGAHYTKLSTGGCPITPVWTAGNYVSHGCNYGTYASYSGGDTSGTLTGEAIYDTPNGHCICTASR